MAGHPEQRRIALWCFPRSGSTAFYRAMRARPSIKVFFEPFSEAFYFGSERVSKRYIHQEPWPSTTYADVKMKLEESFPDKECVFFKSCSINLHGKLENTDCIPKGYQHTFLIRSPSQSIPSFYKAATNAEATSWTYFDPSEANISDMWDLVRLVQKATGQDPVVVDYDDLVDYPEETLRAYCDKTGLQYLPCMLQWKDLSGEELKETFGGWSTGWFKSALNSKTMYKMPAPDVCHDDLPADVKKAVIDNMPIYDKLYRLRIIPSEGQT